MFASDETAQVTGALVWPSDLEAQSTPSDQRQRVTAEKNTDILPPLTLTHDTSPLSTLKSPKALESPKARVAWWQMMQLRKENKHLRAALEEQQTETRKVQQKYKKIRAELDHEVAVVHEGYQQDLAYYQTQLQELTDERNQLSEKQEALEGRYQALEESLQGAVQEEAHKLMQEATEEAIRSSEPVSPLFQDVVKTVEMHVRREEEKHLVEALYLKREVRRMSEILEQERQQLRKEQQQLIAFQLSAHEQANRRQKLLEERIYARQRVFSLLTSFGLLALFIVLEFVCLALFHTPFAGSVTLSILLPILVCLLLRLVLETPVELVKTIYTSAPHRRRVKA